MDGSQIIISFFGILGIIFVLFVVYYIITRWLEGQDVEKQRQASNFPPTSFMDTSGAQCPDYWIMSNNNTIPNTHQCENKFNLPINKSISNTCTNINCYDDEKKKIRNFPTIASWSSVSGRKDIEEQCKWRECCRINTNLANNSPVSIQSSWIGLEEKCGL